jgi:hypothetical protein
MSVAASKIIVSVLITDASAINVEFYIVSNSFYLIILWHMERKIYLFSWRPTILRFKCPKNSGP